MARSLDAHFVDIQEVYDEEREDDDKTAAKSAGLGLGQEEKGWTWKMPAKIRPYRSFGRQVSLGTGVSVLNGEYKEKMERRALRGSGRSLGGYGTAYSSGDARGNKGDFGIFRTRSAIGRQNSAMPSRKGSGVVDGQAGNGGGVDESVNKSVPAGRYFAALTGPELDQVKESEDILLPKDKKWPFLLRFPVGCFGICLGLSSQATLWRALAASSTTAFLHISPFINLSIWLLAVSILLLVSTTYTLKCIFYLEAVRREYFHPVRVNFFFAPWITCIFLAIGAPPAVAPYLLHPSVWCAFMAPLVFLDLKIYGQWLSGGKRRLCKVANPSSHLSVVGNFVGAIMAAKVGWEEAGKLLWAVGFAHYLVVFVTLYQRLPTAEALPKELHPVYSMFIATPAAASIAWGTIYGEFDGLARTCYFIALFLYCSLIVRINFFRGFRFSVSWWSYTFSVTTASVATIRYAEEVPCAMSRVLALTLSMMSSTIVFVLLFWTLLHTFIWKTMFPNDLAIAITKKKQNKERKPIRRSRRWSKQLLLPLVSDNGRQVSRD